MSMPLFDCICIWVGDEFNRVSISGAYFWISPPSIPDRALMMETIMTIRLCNLCCSLITLIRHSFSASIWNWAAAPMASACHLASSGSVRAVRSSFSSIYSPLADNRLCNKFRFFS